MGNKWTKQQTENMENDILDVLVNNDVAMTIDDICVRAINLSGITNQKMARMLSHLIEMGLVVKAKSKSKGRMVYRAVATMGYGENF